MASFRELHEHGQSVWMDYIHREMLERGELADLVAEGVRGVTSNPSIFQKAISEGQAYDDQLDELIGGGETDPMRLYEAVAIRDIQAAADVLRPVYDESGGNDGFVSLEVSPHLAHDTQATIDEARRLWAAVDRPNLMVKVPGTEEGFGAIERLTAGGVNVNVTLLFSIDNYERAALAYQRGLAALDDPSRVASVASFFVSRVDSLTDSLLEEVDSPEAGKLMGRAAIANARLAYRRFTELFGDDFDELAGRGARRQRVLWGSTSTKNPSYSDVRYVEELIGPDTVNTAPPSTLDAFRDHGEVRGDTVMEDWDEAEQVFAELSSLGIEIEAVTAQLLREGVDAFSASFDDLLDALAARTS